MTHAVDYHGPKILEIVERIHQEPSQEYNFSELAKKVGLSYSRFRRVFSEVTGCPPTRYLTKTRTEIAADYLLGTDWTVTEIASSVGIEDPYYFSRLFKTFMGIPPAHFRKRRSVKR
jgi:AraC-like DNA-binding protein